VVIYQRLDPERLSYPDPRSSFASPPPIRSTARTLPPIKISSEGTTSSGPWLRYLPVSNNTSSTLLLRFVIKLKFVVRSSSSYLVDPQWARKFTVTWTSVAAAGIIISLPYLFKSVKQGRAFTGTFGIAESWSGKQYVLAEERQPRKRGALWKFGVFIRRAGNVFGWTLPGFDVSVGQSEHGFSFTFQTTYQWLVLVLLIAGYFATLISCIVLESELTTNANRAGEKIKPSSYQNTFISPNHRLHGSRATSGRLPLLLQEFDRVLSLPRSRIREAELHSPMGRTRAVSRSCYPWWSLDQPTPEVQPPYNRRTERDVGCRSVWSSLHHCSD